MSVPVLTSERLLLRPWTGDDREFCYTLNADETVMAHIGAPVAREAVDDLIARFNSHLPPHGVWLVERDHEPVGAVLFKPVPRSDGAEPDEVEIGWRFVPTAWGHGYATEAARLILAHAWASGVDHLVAVTHPDNAASQRVCGRLGMTNLGHSDAYYDTSVMLFRLDRP